MPTITPRPDLYDDAERWSVDQMRSEQLSRLQTAVRRCYDNVGHYRRKFDERGLHPDDITSLEDIRLLPFTTKADLRDNYPFDMLAVPRKQCVRIHASSGTTGRPTVVGYTQGDIDMWANLVARSLRAAGTQPGDMVHVAYGYGLFTGGLGAHYGAERLGCTVIPVSGGQTEKQIQLIQDFQPDVIMVTPSYFLSLIDYVKSQGLDPAETSLKIGVFGAEPWTEAMRDEVEATCQMHATDIYGLSEMMGPGVAQECVETKDGLTLWEDHFYPEIIDPITEEPMPDGEEGELVLTAMTREAMPVLRYRTRDLTRLLPGTARPSFRRMAKITGRSDDLMIVRGVNVFPTQIEEIVLKIDGLAPYFQCVLTRPGRMDQLTVNVEGKPGLDQARRDAIAKEIAQQIKSRIGTTAQVVVLAEGGVERSVGKARRIVDHRDLT
ncbi:MAG: phenylacetate--CoA ligase PaaK [Ornithinimicrobium sp.]|uniref:phenylacetate--CoA ligase PaaK n=1 Tax=Ornithinimicrobium sp. TaxID=1977084 RepID=UPI0026E0BE86|nr:phenylacetate--CoA ligase PaaK [Ornithinimicrobium sp.]MDO5739911.1 phenylacetate--CoA ligase PaaK [Ornithinimicrobium sp.]